MASLFSDLEPIDLGDFDVSASSAKFTQAGETPVGVATPEMPDYEPTIYTIKFTPKLAAENLPVLQSKQREVDRFRAWATFETNKLTQKKIAAGQLAATGNPFEKQYAIGAYRAKAMDAVYDRRAPWLMLDQAVNNRQTLKIKSSEFRVNILKLAIAGIVVPATAMGTLMDILNAITSSINNGNEVMHSKGVQYWIQFVIYDFDWMSKNVTARIHTISLQTSTTTYDVAKNCEKSQHAEVNISFVGHDRWFNSEVFSSAAAAMTAQQIEAGANALKDNPSFNVDS
ncbi:hypothetical protein Q9L58_008795 [Maublancomyces gigas]|uniref:Uncharacterized protein n=1 Tax=Discina gigas TaxID=1032678 RepID=A0ABR3G8R6_9PEZI